MKYVDVKQTFAEIPDEVCLCIDISNCPYHCPGCHSSYLAQDIGEELNSEVLDKLVEQNPGITCVCLMGGKENEIVELISKSHFWIKGIKRAWYTGQKEMPEFEASMILDYVKVGPYIDELGPLTSKTTNQRLYRVDHVYTPGVFEDGPHAVMVDITSRFWKDEELS